jgi:tetratricopeptide (TPR) repeat protein
VDHPSDELLSAYTFDSLLVPDRAILDAHLAACAVCRERLAELRAFDARLADDDAWPEDADRESAASAELRAAAAEIAREDAEAEALVGELLRGTSEAFVWANLQEKPKYHTGGVVRRLAAAADTACYTAPLHALNLADTAIAIAGMLDDEVYPAAPLASWRGTAWKQRANALRHLGRFPAAFEALERAERYYRLLPRPDLDLAAVTYIRAVIFNEQEQHIRASQLAAESTRAFAHLGQSEMYCASRLLEGRIAFDLGDLETAETIFRQLDGYAEQSGSKILLARATLALANCCIERRALDEATRLLHAGMLLFHDLGVTVAEIRCRWGIARVIQQSEHHRRAVEHFSTVREEFLQLGDATDAALVTLDLMETLLALRKPREVQRAAGNVVAMFANAGMLTGALAAANYLKQAASMRAVTPALLDYLRRYFRRVEMQPDFAFVPPSL